MKYMVKKIIIGVAIGMILMAARSCKVHAASVYLYNAQTVVGDMDFDICEIDNDSMMCINGFTKTLSLKNNNYTTLYINSNKDVFLKNFSISATFGNGEIQASTYGSITNPMYTIFYSTSSSGYTRNKKLQVNFMPSYVKMTMQDDTVCEITDNVGYDFQSSTRTTFPYWQVPSACRTKWLKQIDIIFQSGYNYTGSTSILDDQVNDTSWTNQTWLDNNKNNTYLLWWHNQNVVLTTSVANLQLYFGSNGWGNSKINNSYNTTQQEINENLANLQREIFIASSFIGSDQYDTEQSDKFTNAFSNTITSASEQLNSVGFTSFLNALVVEPISLLNQSASRNFYDSDHHLTGSLCFDTFHQGGDNFGFIPIPFKDTGDYTKDYFQMPCMTTSVYSNLHSNKSHSHNDSIMGFTEIQNGSASFSSVGFISIWLLIQHAILYVWLTITFVNIVKYCIDTKDSEIEVMDL